MSTYKNIQEWVDLHYKYIPETCWIAHVKEMCGLPLRKAHNRKGSKRLKPCPPDKVESIKEAFRFYKMI